MQTVTPHRAWLIAMFAMIVGALILGPYGMGFAAMMLVIAGASLDDRRLVIADFAVFLVAFLFLALAFGWGGVEAGVEAGTT